MSVIPYASLVGEVAALLRRGQTDMLANAWELGQLYSGFLDGCEDGRYPGGTAAAFAKQLGAAGQPVTVSALASAKRIFDRYRQEEIPALVERGYTISHVKLLAALPDELTTKIEVEDEQGRAKPTRAVADAIRQVRSEALAERMDSESMLDAEPREAAFRMGTPAPARSDLGDDHDGGPLIIDAPAIDTTPMDAADAAVAAVGRQVGLVADFQPARPFMPVMKRATNAAEAMADILPLLWRAIEDAGKVGFDSDRQRANFTSQARLLIQTFEALHGAAPEAMRRLEAAVRDAGG